MKQRTGVAFRSMMAAVCCCSVVSTACSDDVADDGDKKADVEDALVSHDSGATSSGGAADAGQGGTSSGGAVDSGAASGLDATSADAGGAADVSAAEDIGVGDDDAGSADATGGADAGCGEKEKCNGVDDDCDGETDEDTCDDGNACTIKTCVPELQVCDTKFKADGDPCDNGQKCTGPDYCQGSVCLPGPATNCNDGNPCTKDSCDAAKNQCSNVAVKDGTSCEDGDACTLGDACGKGLCLPGAVTKCDDANACTLDACDVKAGCSNQPEDGKACDDGDACTEKEACKTGKCQTGAKKACPDGKPCESVTCDSKTGQCGLAVLPDGAECKDGDVCTVGAVCEKGACKGGKPKACDDGNPCTKDSCIAASGGNCLHIKAPEGAACDDGDACTEKDTCKKNACVAVPRACNDDNPCTTNLCVPSKGCQYTNNKNYCEDGDKCTDNDRCKDGKCVAGAARDCDDKQACTVDSCTKINGLCKNDPAPLNGKACAGDGSACTPGDKCVAGKCQLGPAKDCSDGDPCTQDLCDAKTAKCQHPKAKAGDPCNDGSLCTYKDACDNNGKCGGLKLPCADNNGCTLDGCDPKTGACTFKQLKPGEQCDDDDACTVGDVCNSKNQCISGKAKDCNDGNKCSADSCNKKTGKCEYGNAPGDCDDGSLCTLSENCVGGKCAAGEDGRTTSYAGTGQYGFTNGNKNSAKFQSPRDVAVSRDGTMFVLDSSSYRIRKISPAGEVTTLVGNGFSNHIDGKGTKASFGLSYGLAIHEPVGSAPTLWLADRSYHTIRRISMDGTLKTVAGKAKWSGSQNGSGTNARFNRPFNLTVIKDGTVFISDEYNHRIRKMTPTGSVTTFVTGLSRPHGITHDHKSILYVADNGSHRIRRITPSGQVTTLAGGSAGFANGQGAGARFYYPEDIHYSPGNYLVVVDRSNNRIRRVSLTGVASTIAGTGQSGYVNGAPQLARFNYPYGIGIDINGLMYIADTNNNRIRRVSVATLVCDDHSPCTKDVCDPKSGCKHSNLGVGAKCTDGTKCETDGVCDTKGQCNGKPKTCADGNPCTVDSCDPNTGACVHGFSSDACSDGDPCTEGEKCTVGTCMITSAKVSTFTGSGQFGVKDGNGVGAQHYYPRGMDTDGKGNTFVTDASGYRIRKITAKGDVTTIAGNGSSGSTDGAASSARFGYPTDVAVDGKGVIYIADRNINKIRRLADNKVSTWAGSGSSGYTDGKGTTARFYLPEGIDAAADGTVFVADTYNHRIRKIDPQQNVTRVLGTGSQGYSEGGINDARFYRPADVAIGANGDLYVSDSYNHKIRVIRGGKSQLVAGGLSGFADGKGASVRFQYPSGLDFKSGRLYVADRQNHRIRVVEKDGATWTIAGTGSNGWTDGVAPTKARFNSPFGVAADASGLLVGDSSNHRVRRIALVKKDCDDGDPCTADSCDNKTGKCVNAAIKGCCVPTLFDGTFETSADAAEMLFFNCSAGFTYHIPTQCNATNGSFNSKGWQVWPTSPTSNTSKGALYYGYPAGKTYAFGYMHAGTAMTRAIKVPSGSASKLSFSISFDTTTSGLYDRLKVWLWLDGQRQYIGSSQNSPPANGAIWYRGGANNTPKKWYDVSIDTTKYAGKKVQLEFFFNSAKTPSSGSGTGVYVDDVKFTRSCPK